MYIHLGNDITILKKNIIGIFDIEKTTVSKITKEFLANSSKKNEVKDVSYKMPKSFIILENNEKKSLCITNISLKTLKNRLKNKI